LTLNANWSLKYKLQVILAPQTRDWDRMTIAHGAF
jgi:hypothetical protein